MTNEKTADDTPTFIKAQHQFIDQRPAMAMHDADPLSVLSLLWREIGEFEEAYLQEQSPDRIAREAADVAVLVITLFKSIDRDLQEEVLKKIRRNEAKYPTELFGEGVNFNIAAARAKKRWIEMGGDEVFYEKEK